MTASTERDMNELRRAGSQRNVSDLAVFTIREKKKIARFQCFEPSLHRDALGRLLPRVAQKMNAVQRKNALHHSRAVGPPRSDAAPLVVRALKKSDRRSHNGVGRRRER